MEVFKQLVTVVLVILTVSCTVDFGEDETSDQGTDTRHGTSSDGPPTTEVPDSTSNDQNTDTASLGDSETGNDQTGQDTDSSTLDSTSDSNNTDNGTNGGDTNTGLSTTETASDSETASQNDSNNTEGTTSDKNSDTENPPTDSDSTGSTGIGTSTDDNTDGEDDTDTLSTDTVSNATDDSDSESETEFPTDTAQQTDTRVPTDTTPPCEEIGCVVFVDGSGTGIDADGSSWEKAHVNLQIGINNAFNKANGGECEVWVANGTYWSNSTPIQLAPNIAVYGGFNKDEEITDCGRNSRDTGSRDTILSGCKTAGNHLCADGDKIGPVVTGADNSRLDGFVVEQGRHTGDYGGALDALDVDMIVANCLFRSNSSGNKGGAIFSSGGEVTIVDSVFENNSTTNFGGGINAVNNSTVTIQRTLFLNNTSNVRGGAIALEIGANLNLYECALVGNSAGNYGGGIYSDGGAGEVIIQDSVLVNNRPFGTGQMRGAAIALETGSLEVRDSIFTGNSSGSIDGSAIHFERPSGGGPVNADVNIVNSVFFRNRSNSAWNSVYLGPLLGSGVFSFKNNTFWENDGADIYFVPSGGTSISVINSILYKNTGIDPISVAPGDIANSDIRYCNLSFDHLGEGNVTTDGPRFVALNRGASLAPAVCNYNGDTFQTEIRVDGAGWTPGVFRRQFIVNSSMGLTQPIESNSDEVIYVWGPLEAGACSNLEIYSLGLQQGSPCIDAATGIDALQTDILKNERYDAPLVTNGFQCPISDTTCVSAVDIGAYEYVY